jgi:hypothetical protein
VASNPVNIALPKYLHARRAAMARRGLPFKRAFDAQLAAFTGKLPFI